MAAADSEYKQGIVQRFGTGSFNTNLEKTQWDQHLWDMFLEVDHWFVPFINRFGGGSHPSDSYKLQWGEFDQDTVSVTNASGGSASTIVVATGEYLPIIKDDILYSSALSTYLIVTATPTTTTIAVKKLTGTSITTSLAAADYATGASYKRVYTMKADGTYHTSYTDISSHRTVADKYNYIGTFQKDCVITEHEANQSWRYEGLTKRTHLNQVKMKEMLNEYEFHAFIGKSVLIDANLSMGNGILNFSNIKDDTGTEDWTWDQFASWIRTSVKAKNKLARIPIMLNTQALFWIQRLFMNTFKVDISAQGTKEKAGGMNYTEVVVPGAILELYPNYALGELFPSDSALVSMDPKTITRRHIKNMNLATKWGCQPNDAHFILDQHYGTSGWELANPEKLAKLVLATA